MKRNKVSIGTYLYWSKNLASMLYSKLLLLFGVRHSTSVIPEGPYCYTPDYEKNKIAESFTYYVIPCKYYKTLGKRWNGCKYLGIITDDFVFNDQCKMCDKNYGDSAINAGNTGGDVRNGFRGCNVGDVMNLSEIIPLVVVFAMYTTLVVCAVWLVVWGIKKLIKTRNNKTKTK